MKLVVWMPVLFSLSFSSCDSSTFSSSTAQYHEPSQPQSSNLEDNKDPHSSSQSILMSRKDQQVKTIGLFLNYTRELVNYTNKHFPKQNNSIQARHHEMDVEDLLGGILADEFNSIETGFGEDDGDDGDDDLTSGFRTVDDSHEVGSVVSKDRQGRARQVVGGRKGPGKKNGSKQQVVDVAKYNGYVDAVFKRMNSLIRSKRMDPLRVNLFAGKQQNGQKKAPEGGVKKPTGHGNRKGQVVTASGGGHHQNKKNQNKGGKGKKKKKNQNQKRKVNVDDDDADDEKENFDKTHSRRHGRSETSTESIMTPKLRPSSMEFQTNRSTSSSASSADIENSSPTPTTSSSSSSESKELKDNPNRPTRGVLHGLSTLRRAGAVKVLRRGPDVRLVRAKFLLGPVALDILPKKSSNGTKSSNMPSTTATARSLNGVLEIRLKNAGPTRIRKLRVFPPANVRVEGEKKGMKKQGYRKVTPVAARRLMSVANEVVRQTERQIIT